MCTGNLCEPIFISISFCLPLKYKDYKGAQSRHTENSREGVFLSAFGSHFEARTGLFLPFLSERLLNYIG